MDDVGGKLGVEQHFQNGAAEEGKALAVVVEAIQAAPLEVVLVVQEVELHSLVLVLKQAAILVAPAHGNGEVGEVGELAAQFLLDVAVQGHHYPALHPGLDQFHGKAASYVAQTARGGEGLNLACAIQNFHMFLLIPQGGRGRGSLRSPTLW